MTVYTVDRNGHPGMPTFNIKKIRHMLRDGRAVIYRHHPFTVMLLHRENMAVQDVELTEDAGYEHIGLSVKSEKHEYTHAQYDLLKDEKQRHDDRRKYRRTRRNRKRYRKPRFDNRKKPEGWLAPSLKNKKDRHIDLVKRYMEVCPIKSVTTETASFDTQLLEAMERGLPAPEGAGYQYGPRYMLETLREAVFMRDGHTCLVCGKKDKILRVHHVGYWKEPSDHSDRMGNLASVCTDCHTAANHRKGGALYGWEPKLRPMTGAAFMNAVRWKIVEDVKALGVEVHSTYGAVTKADRGMRHIGKTHANDAYCMGKYRPLHRAREILYRKRRRNNRILEKFYDAKYTDTRDGSKKSGSQLSCGRTNRSESRNSDRNLRPFRGKKLSKGRRSIRRNRYAVLPGSKVLVEGIKAAAKGVHCSGTRLLLTDGRSVSIKKITLLSFPDGWEQVVKKKEDPEETGRDVRIHPAA